MRITLLGHSIPSTGEGVSMGIARYIYSLGAALKEAGNDVNLFIRNDGKPKEGWIKTVYSPKFSWIPYPLFAYPKMMGNRADVFHSDFVTTGASLVWARKKPAIVSMHDALPFTYDTQSIPLGQKLSIKWYMRCFRAARNADAIILMSEHARKEAIRLAGIEPEKTHAVYNGIDHSVFRPMGKRAHKTIRIGYLGGLDGRKNVGLLVESFRVLAKERDDIELHVAGGGSNLERFRGMGVRNAFFYGHTKPEDAPSFYNNLDIFVMPSLQEGFGMMTLEAMSCGLPVIGVNRSSTPEILGKTGLLVEPQPETLAKVISKLLDNKRLRQNMARNCLERSKDFSWDICARENMKIYESLLAMR